MALALKKLKEGCKIKEQNLRRLRGKESLDQRFFLRYKDTDKLGGTFRRGELPHKKN